MVFQAVIIYDLLWILLSIFYKEVVYRLAVKNSSVIDVAIHRVKPQRNHVEPTLDYG